MQEKYYFISDVHLGLGDTTEPSSSFAPRGLPRDEVKSYDRKDAARAPTPDFKRERRLLEVLQTILHDDNAKGLFIVGDLFDSWFEYRSVVPRRHVRTLAKLAEIAEKIPVEYLMGNHDFGHRDFFVAELGIPIIDGDIERELFGKKFYIAHGDGKALNDSGYLILRKFLRNRTLLRLYSWLHPDLGIALAEKVSKGSRGYTDGRDALQKQDGLALFAEKKIRDEHFDYVVMGHRHLPQITEIHTDAQEILGRYVNLGDWIKHYTYGVFDESGFSLVEAG